MPFEDTFTLRQLVLNASTFTDVAGLAVVPIECGTVVIINTSAINCVLRSDPANALSEIPLVAGQQFELPPRQVYNRNSWPAGASICSLKAASGTPTVIVECIK